VPPPVQAGVSVRKSAVESSTESESYLIGCQPRRARARHVKLEERRGSREPGHWQGPLLPENRGRCGVPSPRDSDLRPLSRSQLDSELEVDRDEP
jgi:hypothetical protein